MTRDEFERAVLRHGPDLERWPDEDAAAARALLSSDAAAAALLDEARHFENALRMAVAANPASPFAVSRIVAGVGRRPTEGFGPARWRLAATSLAAAASIAGFVAGVFGGAGAVPADDDLLLVIDEPALGSIDVDVGLWL